MSATQSPPHSKWEKWAMRKDELGFFVLSEQTKVGEYKRRPSQHLRGTTLTLRMSPLLKLSSSSAVALKSYLAMASILSAAQGSAA